MRRLMPGHEGEELARTELLAARYVLVSPLGEGGMGRVHRAYDTKLRREVALKFHRVTDASEDAAKAARERLVREAQVLAKLAHPHVVTVYDVGEVDEGVFVAMELVEGDTLRAWQTGRTRRAIIDAYLAAGEGLAAAHRAGVLHRDFKPENVMVGHDGRVRVVDFGLARALAEAPAEGGAPTASYESASSAYGTPRYMAPEQWLGQPVDARADQYSFCVSLYEALEGRHPLLAEKSGPREGRLAAKARGRTSAALARGLSVDPNDRFATLDDLLRALRPPRRGALSAAVVALAVTGVGIVAWRGRSPCATAGRLAADAWDAPRRAQMAAQFQAADATFGPEAFAATAAALDRFGEGWAAAQKAACVATRVDGTQSEALLDRRTACLEERLGSFRALTTTLSGPLSVEEMRRAAPAANGLPSVETCADAPALLAFEPVPVPVAQRAEVTALDGELHAATMARMIGRLPEARASVRHVRERAEALGQPRLMAAAMSIEGDTLIESDKFEDAAKEYRAALPKAIEAHSVDTELRLLTNLFSVLGENLARHEAAMAIAEIARAALGRPGVTDELRAMVDVRYGLEVLHTGSAKDAQGPLEQALLIRTRLYGPDSTQVAEAQNHLSIALKALGDYQGAATRSELAAKIFGDRLGTHAIDRARALTNTGSALKQLGKYEDAIAQYRRALATSERVYGPDHPIVARGLSNVASVLIQTGHTEDALPLLLRSAAIFEHTAGSHPGDAASTFINLGEAEAQLGRPRDAQAHYERAAALIEAKMSPTHQLLAYPLIGLADLFLKGGKPALAKPLLVRVRGFVDESHLDPSVRSSLPELYRRAGM